MSRFARKQAVIAAVKELISAEWYAENHPEQAHGSDSVDYAEENLDKVLQDYVAPYAEEVT